MYNTNRSESSDDDDKIDSIALRILAQGETPESRAKRSRQKGWIGIICVIFFFLYSAGVCWVMVAVAMNDESLQAREHLIFTIGITCDILQALLLIDYIDAFHIIMRFVTRLEPFKFIILSINVLLMCTVMISLQISDSQDDTAIIDSREVDAAELVILWPITVFSFIIFFAHWDIISFSIANSDYALSFIYFTIFGGIFTMISRFLHSPDRYKPPLWAWHRRSSSMELTLHYMIIFSFLFTLAVPFGGGIMLAMFAEFANSLQGVVSTTTSVIAVVILFLIMAHVMMIIPTAPASVIDISGGFIFTQIFQNQISGSSFAAAISITMILLLSSHFTGSCLQWYLGKIPFVQGWLNRVCPIGVLAMLDSALQESSFWKVGIYCSVAPDTIAGFAQGRSNLRFCVQFWAEYSAIPHAICTILIGSALSQKEIRFLVPALIMITVVVNIAMGAYALKEIAYVLADDGYILSATKWKMVQYMMKTHGLSPTKDGWKQDVWMLASESGLFEKIFPLEKAKVLYLKDCKDPKQRREAIEYFDDKLESVQQEHYKLFTKSTQQTLKNQKYIVKRRRSATSSIIMESTESTLTEYNSNHVEALQSNSPWIYNPKKPGFNINDELICIFPSNKLKSVKGDIFQIKSKLDDGALACEFKGNQYRQHTYRELGRKVIIPMDRFEKFRPNTNFAANRKTYQKIIFGCMYVTMAGSYNVFTVDTNETVEQGMEAVSGNTYFLAGLGCLILHFLLAIFYFWHEISIALTRLNLVCQNVCCGRISSEVEGDLETSFETPHWLVSDWVEGQIERVRNEAKLYLDYDALELCEPKATTPDLIISLSTIPEHPENPHSTTVE